MRLIKLSCANCNAPLEIDLEHLLTYCPYCGQKLMIDADQLNKILSEKEKTKRTIIREEAQTKREEMKYEHQEREMKNEESETWKALLLALILIAICSISLWFMSFREQRAHINDIQMTFSAKEVKGEFYEDVAKRFESLGFVNIEFVKDEDLIFAIFSKDGEVEKITIDGDSSFEKGEWFSKDSVIVITYHTFKAKSN